MKNLFLSLVLVMVGLVANSQVFVVTTDTIQKFQHPKEVNFIPSLENGLINYTKLGKGKVVYTIDVQKESLTMKNGEGVIFNFVITEFFKSNSTGILVSFECVDKVKVFFCFSCASMANIIRVVFDPKTVGIISKCSNTAWSRNTSTS